MNKEIDNIRTNLFNFLYALAITGAVLAGDFFGGVAFSIIGLSLGLSAQSVVTGNTILIAPIVEEAGRAICSSSIFTRKTFMIFSYTIILTLSEFIILTLSSAGHRSIYSILELRIAPTMLHLCNAAIFVYYKGGVKIKFLICALLHSGFNILMPLAIALIH